MHISAIPCVHTYAQILSLYTCAFVRRQMRILYRQRRKLHESVLDRGEEPFHAARFRYNHNNRLKKSEPVSGQEHWVRIMLLAPQVGLEPTTTRLTAECSAIELLRNMESGGDLCSRAVSSQVRSALRGLTSVFGMGTGGTLSSLPPEMVSYSVEGSGGTKLFSLSLAVRRTLTTAQQ